MDLDAYHRAWMSGSTESESVRIGEDALFDRLAHEAEERAHYDALLRAEHESELAQANK
jgi:hypothetical protein